MHEVQNGCSVQIHTKYEINSKNEKPQVHIGVNSSNNEKPQVHTAVHLSNKTYFL